MITHGALIPFILATLLTNATPGAAMLYNINTTLKRGKWYGLLAALGVELGTFVYVLIVSFGLANVITTSTFLYKTIKLCGQLYLLYLAYTMLPNRKTAVSRESHFLSRNPLAGGFLLNVLNPQMLVFFITILPQFVPAQDVSTGIFFTLGMIFVGCSIIFSSLLVLFCDSIYLKFKKEDHQVNLFSYFPSLTFCLIVIYGLATF